MATSGTGLVVPINVVAFCVSADDAQETTGGFAGATVDYQYQTGQTGAYLGENVVRALSRPTAQRLEAGVHLHWALPDALTRAANDPQTGLQFSPVPDRWLVTRLIIDGANAVSPRCWVIESDTLNLNDIGQYAVTVPIDPANGQDYGELGQWFDLDSYAPHRAGVLRFRDAAHAELSAVANGTPLFAVYYPNCRSTFGFVDTLADVSQSANLMYVVTGWFSTPAPDPARQGPARQGAGLRTTHKWAAAGSGQTDYTLYSGFVQDVAWDLSTINKQYVTPSPIGAEAAVGNTPSEALAACLGAGKPMFEQLLNWFQHGLLKQFKQPQPDQMARFAEAMHDSQFQAVPAGRIYAVARTASDGTRTEVIDLPLPLADALNQLNIAAQKLAEAENYIENFQWQMFATWFRYFASPQTSDIARNHAMALNRQWRGSGENDQSGLRNALGNARTGFDARYAAVQAMLGDNLYLRPAPAPRYWQPTEPSLLLRSPDLIFPARYGGDNSFSGDGTLTCRTTDQLVEQVTVGGQTVAASAFAAVTALPSATLPYATDCSGLLAEACLLNTRMASARTGQKEDDLETALLDPPGDQSPLYWTVSGLVPSPVALSWWDGNPWLPLLLSWTIDFIPLQPTTSAGAGYDPRFFSANYRVGPDHASFISYAPDGSAQSINLDPAQASDAQSYAGQTILSPAAARALATNLEAYLAQQPDPDLQGALDALQQTPTLVQPLAGFVDALLTRACGVQLKIRANARSRADKDITDDTQAIVGPIYRYAPLVNGDFNPIRAGYFQIDVQAVDVFGQRRDIFFSDSTGQKSAPLLTSEAMTIANANPGDSGIAYAAPRLAQPARLLFQWLSASAAGLAEMNAHPASTPVCGWLLPDHVVEGFFLYDGAGRPLGSLRLNGERSAVVWQSAPGDDTRIDQPIAQALAAVNPVFAALAISLCNAAADFFESFWRAVDRVHGGINPLASNAGLSVLIGRPVAVAQAMLRLDLHGRPFQNQTADLSNGWTDTDNGFAKVSYPVVLGDIDQLDDGLIGYYRMSGGGYDLTTFFTEGASGTGSSGVVQPTQQSLLLTPTPAFADPQPPPLDGETTRVLLLVDPRASVHAVTGILPTQSLQIPPDIAADALSGLELWYLVAPALKAASGFAIPVPREGGYSLSWLEQDADTQGNPIWAPPVAGITPAAKGAVSDYSPQSLTEGWLRLNPTVLRFDLLNATGQALLTGGAAQTMTLRVTNAKPALVTFTPGQLQAEGQPPQGSQFFVHLGALVDQADVAATRFSADGWSFAAQNDPRYGAYWAATPSVAPVSLESGESFDIQVDNLKAVGNAVQAQLYFDYYDVDGSSDGVSTQLVTIQEPQHDGAHQGAVR